MKIEDRALGARAAPQRQDAAPEPASEVVDPEMAEILRAKTPAERLDISSGLWRHATRLLRAHLSSQHPDWRDDQVEREIARRMAHGSW